MARKKSKQQGVVQKELVPGQQTISKNPVSPGDAAGGGGGDAGLDRLATRANQPMHTCCLLCHREFKDWGASSVNGLPGGHGTKLADAVPALSQALLREVPGRKLADAVPSLSQSLLGEVPLWICQSCRKSVEEEERRSTQEQPMPVPLSHSSSCKSQSCGNGYPEQSSVDWDPSSFLSAHKLSGLWNSTHTNGGVHCNHNASSHSQQGITGGSACHDKRGPHEAPGKSAKTSGTKVCPYSHPSSQISSGSSAGNPLSTSADLCKTTPKHFKTMCRRPTPPGEAFHPSDHPQHSDLSVPPNSPTGLSSQHSSLVPPKQSSGPHGHVTSSSSTGVAAHAPFSSLVPNLHGPTAKLASSGPDSPTSLHKPSPCKNSHIPAVNTQHSKLGTSLMGCNHPCNGHNGGTVASTNVGHLTAGACRDQACKGHKLANGTLCHPPSELEEGEDEDSSSERSSCASSSTNQKDGKYCDCCYCEFFGHNAPPAAPTSRNYAEIREKLRSRLTRRKEELPQRQDSDLTVAGTIDNRDVDELLDFINSSEPKPVNSAKAAKRARHKQKKKEKAQQGSTEAAGSDPHSTSSDLNDEAIPDGSEARLLDWPQLELERVNSFLTSRLEEIKNTIKDSIRASFSMYDLNLDVNDFPKKAATLEGNHLLSHLNGSSDLQQIDLDLAPLSLGTFKSHLDLVNGWEDTATISSSNTTTTTAGVAAGPKDIQRLHTTPNLSKLIRVRSPERCASTVPESVPQAPAQAPATAKSKEEAPDPKNTTAGAAAAKSKKSKKQQQRQEQPASEQNPTKPSKAVAGTETQKTNESRVAEVGSNGSKAGNKQLQHSADNQRNGPKKAEESRSSRQATNGAISGLSNAQRGKGDTEARGGRSEQDSDGKAHPISQANGQQPKGKNKKNKSKGEKSSSAIDDVFLPKDVDPTEMDEIDREVEYFKRFCLDSAKQTRQKVAVNWSNFSLKKVPSNAAQ
ncbi:protein FAM193B [Polymixia lowei]